MKVYLSKYSNKKARILPVFISYEYMDLLYEYVNIHLHTFQKIIMQNFLIGDFSMTGDIMKSKKYEKFLFCDYNGGWACDSRGQFHL